VLLGSALGNLAKQTAAVPRPRRKTMLRGAWSTKHSMEWLYTEAFQILSTLVPTAPERKLPRQEFDLADMLQAAARASDLSIYVADMPPFFWIFAIGLVYTIIYLAEALAELWVDAAVTHYGVVAYCLLLPCTVTWPAFIHYLVHAFLHGFKVMQLHQRTVQLLDVPPAFCTYEAVEGFCKERGLPVSSVLVPKPPEEGQADMQRLWVDLTFETVDAMKRAFRDDVLAPHLKVSGKWVRVRPKSGKNTASVEMFLVSFEYLQQSVSERYWLRGTLSCLVTMALAKHVRALPVWTAQRLLRMLGVVGWLAAKIGVGLSLVLMFFFVGYHSLAEIEEAREDLRNESRAHRQSVEARPLAAPGEGEAPDAAQTSSLLTAPQRSNSGLRSRSAPAARRRDLGR